MFTGIVQALGRVESIASRATAQGDDCELRIDAAGLDVAALRIGDSVAVNGVCLTVLGVEGSVFRADVSAETLARTTLGGLTAGSVVNLEPALRAGDALGGHLMSGHVDGTAVLLARRPDARSERFEFEAPAELARFIARKGSVCIDGVSLTVNDVNGVRFGVNLIPHTLEVTTLGGLGAGARVNIEVDLIARYVVRWLESAGK